MIINVLVLIVGFALLIKGADMFVDGAASTAENFKVSKLVIGITIIAFGTSAPEFAVSFKALMSHSGDMVLGNVIGSNIIIEHNSPQLTIMWKTINCHVYKYFYQCG